MRELRPLEKVTIVFITLGIWLFATALVVFLESLVRS